MTHGQDDFKDYHIVEWLGDEDPLASFIAGVPARTSPYIPKPKKERKPPTSLIDIRRLCDRVDLVNGYEPYRLIIPCGRIVYVRVRDFRYHFAWYRGQYAHIGRIGKITLRDVIRAIMVIMAKARGYKFKAGKLDNYIIITE